MSPFSAIFGVGVKARNAFYDHGWLQSHQLRWPVVSVGNLSVGGSGKTPLVIHLGTLLQSRGFAFDILSRGYGRKGSDVKLVEENGNASEFGDEPLLIAKKLHVPVIVGADRYAAGLHAEKMFSELRPAHGANWLHLLDDGFQHRRLARDFDIVIVSPDDISDRLLPSGRMREPLSALRRADAVVLTEGISADALQEKTKHVWRVTRSLDLTATDIPERPIAICGIARPQRFIDDLRSAGIALAAEAVFPDHHAYTERDVRELLQLRKRHQSCGFVTTEKDAINLKWQLAALQPVSVVPLKMELIDPANALDTILGTLAEKLQCRTTG